MNNFEDLKMMLQSYSNKNSAKVAVIAALCVLGVVAVVLGVVCLLKRNCCCVFDGDCDCEFEDDFDDDFDEE